MQKSKYLIAALMTLGGLTLSAQTFQSEGLSYKVLSAIEHTVQLTASDAANPTEVNYNPQNETCDALRTKRVKIKTKRFSVSKRSVPLRCFQGYPNSARIRQGLGLPYNSQNEIIDPIKTERIKVQRIHLCM